MLNKESIYQSSLPKINEHTIIVTPHSLLRPYIANYTFTNPSTMLVRQTILPTISTTLVCTFQNGQFIAGLRGVNTKPVMIADYARQFDFMFLIEFHAAGLYPFLEIDQNHLTNEAILLNDLNQDLLEQISEAYYTALNLFDLINQLNTIFLKQLTVNKINPSFSLAFDKLLHCNGHIRVKDLAKEHYYSEKQLNRLFIKYAGAKVKTCSRIIRIKKAAELLKDTQNIGLLYEQTGHHDYSHFVHDFTAVYGITPKEYLTEMSLFYNDPHKL